MEAPPRFQVGQVYERGEIHEEYNGQRQGGIITPVDYPVVFIITGSTGLEFGYADEWDDEGVFHYFGEGQAGDMRFEKGNTAVRDHAKRERELHLFERTSSGFLRYVGEMLCAGYEWKVAPDKHGTPRQAIVFQLVPAATASAAPYDGMPSSDDLAKLAQAADIDPTECSDPGESRRKTYARSRALRTYVRTRANGVCEGCGMDAPFVAADGNAYLEAHHTQRRSDFGPGNRKTVIALCPNCHTRVHFGVDGDAYNAELKSKLQQIEPGEPAES
jgi:5-methylcytosine-specific restriction protein A